MADDREQTVQVEAEAPEQAPGPEPAVEAPEEAPVEAPENPEPPHAQSSPSAATSASGDDLSEALTKAQEYLGLAQRTQADFENYRKRMARETAAAVDRGVEKLAKEILPALDHLDLAIKAAAEHDAGDWLKGIQLVQDELTSALARAGIQAFSPQGEPFDPNEHEAMAQQPSEEAEAGTVIQVYQSGYRLNGQVLRPARVVVSGGAPA